MQIWTPVEVYEYLKKEISSLPSSAHITKNFQWMEVLENQTEAPGVSDLENLSKIINILQDYREKYFNNNAVIITSGWRELFYNRKIGSSDGSFHVRGQAIDFYVPQMKIDDVKKIMDRVHKGGTGSNLKQRFCHIDLGIHRRWDY